MAEDTRDGQRDRAEAEVREAKDIGRNTTDRERLEAEGQTPPAPAAESRAEGARVQERRVGPLDVVQQASEDSFPASDPPAHSPEGEDKPPRQG